MDLHFNYGQADDADLERIPLAEAPAGYQTDLQGNPGNQSGIMIGLATAFLTAMLVVVGLRFYTKLRIVRAWSWDDLTLSFGFAGTIGVYILTCVFGVVSKVGSHVWNVPIGLVYSTTWTSENDCFDTLVPLTMLFVKLTFFTYLFNTFYSYRWLRISTLIGMVITCLFYTAIVIAQLCVWVPQPGEALPLVIPEGKAWAMNVMMFAMACGGLVLDLAIWTLPMAVITQIRASGRKTCGLGCIFFVGLIAILASCLSMVYRVRSNMSWDSDFLFFSMPTILCTFIELSSGCIAASLPSLVILYNHLRHKSQLKRYGSGSAAHSFALASTSDNTIISSPDRGRRQYLNRKASVLSDGVATITENMAHPFSKIADISRRSSITALPDLEHNEAELELQPRRSHSVKAIARNGSALADMDEKRQKMTMKSFENFRSRDIEPWERWEALKNWPPEPAGSRVGLVTKRYEFEFGD